MSTPGPRGEKGELAARILVCARDMFAENGWAGTTIRAIARAADVDPALVYHYFESKERLLEAATEPPAAFLQSAVIAWQGPTSELGVRLVRNFLANWNIEEHRRVIRATLMTAAHEASTRSKLKQVVETSLMGPAAIGLDEDDRKRRSGLVASQLLGLAMVRYVWQIEPVASMSDDEVVASIAPTLQRYIDGVA